MSNKSHVRSKLNQALDKCPEIVQQAVWGEGGLRYQVELLTDALEYAYNKLFIITKTPGALRRADVKKDAIKAFDRVGEALQEVKGCKS